MSTLKVDLTLLSGTQVLLPIIYREYNVFRTSSLYEK